MRADEVTDGLAVVDKAAGMTSHDVVARFRRLARTRRVGHAGTLDPMATGVLLLAVGRATRLLNHLDLNPKGYTARVRLGQATTTDDAEGEVLSTNSAAHLADADIVTAMLAFTGEIRQVPSSVSAIKVNGERAYKRVRDGESVELSARPVSVYRFEALGFERVGGFVDVDVSVQCSAGTYVRALARDLGQVLGVGGHLTMLRRTQVGAFGIDQALTLEQLSARADPVMVSMADAVRAAMPVRAVTSDELHELSFGRPLPSVGITGAYAAIGPDGTVAALLRDDDAAADSSDPIGWARPVIVFVAR
jgi:tRNA pseudouridine55 synthase